MSAIKSLPPIEALETFRENHPDLGIDGILAVSEASFIERYTNFFEGDSRKARSAYREAQRIRALTTLLWANIKDTVGSPYLQETLFNNIPDTFLDHQGMIPAYPQLFGNLDFIECEHCRSIFGPAAYFVDLLRFIEKYIPQDNLPVGHSLEERQPRLFGIPLDCENTFSLIPYIDLVNEVLEDVVRTGDTPDAYEVVAETVFPMSLPFHLPLAQIRLYLGQLKLTLQAIYRLFGEVDAAIAREILALSPSDYTQLGGEITDKDALDAFYGLDVLATGKDSLEDIAVFLEQTGLSRPELDQLLFLDLSTAEVEIGLSRLSFINATGDQQGAIAVENTVQDILFTRTSGLDTILESLNERQLPATLSADFSNQGIDLSSENTRVLIDRPSRLWRVWQGDSERIYCLTLKDGVLTAYSEAYDRLTNLTLPKLERIYRFLKLARQLNWSFADLDWALRSLADLDLAAQSLDPVDTAQTVLQFDGVNDFVQIPNATDLQLNDSDTPTLTLEAWIYLDGASIHPILTKGDADGPFTQYQFWITPTGRLSFYSYLQDDVDPTTLFVDGQVPNALTQDDLALIDDIHPVDDRGNQPTADGDGSFYTIDNAVVGLNLTSHGAIALNCFNHIAVTMNEVLADANAETDGDQTVYQLKFYLNGVLDSTWSLLAPIPLDQAPPDASATEIRLGTNYHSDFLVGSLSEVRLWNRIRTEAEIQRDRLSRLQGGETGLLAYWPLIDTPETELVDLAPGNAHPGYLGGTSHSSQPRWIQRDLVLTPLPVAIADTALSFNGRDEYLAAEQVQGLDLREFTLEAWVKLDAAGQRHGLITKGDATTGVTHFQWWIDADNRLKLSSANTDDVSSNVIAASTLTADRVHLSVVVGADGIQFFVNGESKGSRDAVAFTPSGGDLYLGRSFDEATYLQGTMQAVRIWRGPRSQTQLVQNRDRQLTGAEAGLVGYWRLDSRDAAALTDDGLIRDLSFNRNHLHLGGLLAIYQPQLDKHPEVILPDPVASPAQVLNFDPQHYAVTIINPQDYGLGHYEQFTLQLWFRVEDAKLGDRKQVLFTQGDTETGLSLYLSEDGRLRAHAWCHTLDGTQLKSLTLSTGVVRANRWYQVTLVYDETANLGTAPDGVNYRLYLSGTAGEATPDGFRLDQVGPMHLGGLTADVITRFHDGDGLGNAHSFAGQITDFRLWQVAFTEDDILKPEDAQHPRHIPPTESSDLLAYLPLTEGYGAPVGEHTGLLYAPTNDDPALLTPIIYDQTPETNGQVNHGNLSVGPDAVAPKWSISPRPPLHPDTALAFQGGYVRLPDTVDLGLIDQSFTIELWVKVAAFDAALAVLSASSSLSLTLETTGDIQAQLGTTALTSSRALTVDQWHHLAWRFDQRSSNQSLLIDGQPVGELAGASALGEATQLLLAQGFQGSISELRIWNQARTDAEILAHWNLRLAGNEAGLQGYWVFDTEPAQRWIDAVAGYPALLESLDESDLAPRVEIETPFSRQEISVGLNDTDAIAELIDLPKTVLASTGTVELWVQFSRARNQTLWDASTATTPFILALQNQVLRFRVADSSGTPTIVEIDLTDWPSAFETQIHHIAATWQFDDGVTQIQLYLDDAIARSIPEGNGDFPLLGRPVLGLGAAGTEPFVGTFHQVRLWDQVRQTRALQQYRDADLTGQEPGLQLYLPLSEAAGTRLGDLVSNRSVYAKALPIPQNNPQWITLDRAVELDGNDDYIDAAGYVPGDQGTIELWAKFSRDREQVIFDASNDEFPGDQRVLQKAFALRVEQDFVGQDRDRQEIRVLTLLVEDGGGERRSGQNDPDPGDTEYEARIVISGDDFADFDRQWHHIVVTWQFDADAQTVIGSLYLDLDHQAELIRDPNSPQVPSGSTPTLMPLFIGANVGDYEDVEGPNFEGQIRQLRIWNQVRAEADLRDLQDQSLDGDEGGLQVYLPINEGSGTVLGNLVDPATPATLVLEEIEDDDRDRGNAPTAIWHLVNTAIALNGIDQFIGLPSPIPAITGSAELWVKFASERDQVLLDASDSDDRQAFVIDLAANQLRFWLHDDANAAQIDLSALAGLPPRWHHVVVTWQFDAVAQTANLGLYLDDRPAATAELTEVLPPEDLRNPYIGMHRGEAESLSDYWAFAGEIRQLRLWNRVQTPEAIRRLRRVRLDGDETGLVAYFPIEAGEGTVLIDPAGDRPSAQLYTRLLAEPQWNRIPARLRQFDQNYAVLAPMDTLGLAAGNLTADDFTVEVWVNLPDITGEHPILGTRGPIDDASPDIWAFSVVDGALQVQMQGQTLDGSDLTLTNDTWHHVALRYQAGELSLWLDGSTSAQTLTDIAPLTTHRRLYAAHWRTATGQGAWRDRSLTGLLDELRFWSVALPDAVLEANTALRLSADTPNLTALWRFNDAQQSTLRDRSPNLNHRTLVVDPSAEPAQTANFEPDQPPIFVHPSVLQLDGYNDYLDLGTPFVQVGDAWTLAFWFNCAQTDGTQVLFSKAELFSASVVDSCFQLEWQFQGDRIWEEAFFVNPGEWNHVAIVYSGSDVQIFHNGVSVADAQPATFKVDRANALRFGVGEDLELSRERYFQGYLAQIEFWGTGLAADEIAATLNHPLTGREADLLAYWPIDEGSGSILYDQSEYWPQGTLIAGLENPSEKWLADPPPITGALSALALDGLDDHVYLGELAQVLPASLPSFTVEAWVKLSNPADTGTYAVLGSSVGDGATNGLGLGIAAGRPVFQLGDSVLQADTALDDQWHHLAWQYDAATTTATIVLDGVEITTGSLSLSIAASAIAYLGRWQTWDANTETAVDHYLPGLIGEVRIWQGIRQLDAIAADHAQRLIGNEADLLAYWILDDAHQVAIPAQLGQGNYQAILASDLAIQPPLWQSITNHPIWLNPLPQEALAFDGERHFLALDNFTAAPPSFTLEAWVNNTQSDTETRPRQTSPVFWRGQETDTGFVADFELSITDSGQIAFFYRPAGDDLAPGDLKSLVSADTFLVNQFAHIAVTVESGDTTTIQLFLDGEPVAEITEDAPIRASGPVLLAGWGNAGGPVERFRGLIQEIRFWSETRNPSELKATRYNPLDLAVQPTDLIGYWPLTTVNNGLYTPNSVSAAHPFRLGGLSDSRQPDQITVVERPATFLDADQRVLTLTVDLPDALPIPPFNATTSPNRQQRTIEVWFLSENPLAAATQVIYHEGDATRGLSITLASGLLTFQGYNLPTDESAWQVTQITTDRVRANRWHHAAIVLNGRADVQDNGFCALLDGQVIDSQPGSQLWGAIAPLNLGGIQFTPTAPASIVVPAQADDVIRTGNWHVTATGSLHDRNKLKGSKSLTFPVTQPDGVYRLFLAYPADDPLNPSHASAVKITVAHADGSAAVTLDLRRGGNPPTEIGVFKLTSGTSTITVSNDETDGLVIVDGLHLVPLVYQDAAVAPPPVELPIQVSTENKLQGQIKEVRIWEAARNAQEIWETRYDISGVDAALREDLLFHWDTTALGNIGTAPLVLPEIVQYGGLSGSINLVNLAAIAELQQTTEIPLERLITLWSGLRYFGNGDDRTLFDTLFNPTGTPEENIWVYYPSDPRLWRVDSREDDDRAIRSRLMGALRVSHSDLDLMVRVVSGVDTVAELIVVLDGDYLTLLYRLRLLSTVLKLSIADVIKVMTRLQAEVDLNSLANLTLDDVVQLRDRAAWHQASGIDVPEYEFLVYDEPDRRVAVPYDEGSVVDSATDLIAQVQGILLSPISFVSQEVSEAASTAIYQTLLAAAEIEEIELTLPAADAATSEILTLAVVLPVFEQFTDLTPIATAMNWADTFENQVISVDELTQQGLIDDLGQVLVDDPAAALRSLVRQKVTDPQVAQNDQASLRTLSVAAALDPEQTLVLRDLLVTRWQVQIDLPDIITTQLQGLREEVDVALLTAWANLLDTTLERLQSIISHTEGNTYDGVLIAPRVLTEMNAIANDRRLSASDAIATDLAQLYKTLFLLSQFDLSAEETETLLADPLVFDLTPTSLLTPTLDDLVQLHDFVQLKSALNDPGNRVLELLQVESEPETAIAALTDWQPGEIPTLANGLGILDRADYVTIPALTELQQGFAMLQTLGADAAYLIDLADGNERDFATYRRQADTLLELLRAKYSDEQWPRILEPIHDILAEQQRDSLVAVALEELSEELTGRKSPDVLYEYLLIDVQTNSPVDTSRIVQAIAALQLYVQRCLMSLERDVDPSQIPSDEWLWMKNYRVWEANRKVFLYPENFIEPELRDTKTPLFQALEDELNQVDVTQDTAEVAYTRYLDSFAEVTNLTIVGSYLDTDRIPPNNTVPVPEFTGNLATPLIEVENSDVGALLPQNFTVELWVNHNHSNSVGGVLSAFQPETRSLQVNVSPYRNFSDDLINTYVRLGFPRSLFEQFVNFTINANRGWGLGINQGKIEIFVTTQEIVANDLSQSSPRTLREHTILRSRESYPADRWFHVAITYNSSNLRLYVDGTEVTLDAEFDLPKTQSPNGPIRYLTPPTPLTLGSFDNGQFFNGQLREVRVWNQARSRSQIQATLLDGIATDAVANEANLIRYWKLDEGVGNIVNDLSAGRTFRFGDSDLANGRIQWAIAPSTETQLTGEDATVSTTLYLVGRNDATQEYYLRTLVDGITWTPWEKIDLSISADFVAPVFAFNKLYLFWAEIQDSVRAENRRWANARNFNARPVDQLGDAIILRESDRPSGTINPRSFANSFENDIIDNVDGGSINNRTHVYSDKFGVIEQVNITVQKPVVKFSFYNFSRVWTQPQTYETVNVELDEWQQRQPKWRRVYAQRWRDSEVAPAFQVAPTTQTDVTVARLVANSFVAQTLPAFVMDDLTVSFWLRAEDRLNGQSEFVDEPAVNTFTLFSYDTNGLTATLTHQSETIDQRLETFEATQTGRNALLNDAVADDNDNPPITGVQGAIAALVNHRDQSLTTLDATIAALNKDIEDTLANLAQAAANAFSFDVNDPDALETVNDPTALSAQVLANQAVLSADAAIAALTTQQDTPEERVTLAENLAQTAERTRDAAIAAREISGQAESVLDNVRASADAARTAADEIAQADTVTDADIDTVIDHVQATLSNALPVLNAAVEAERNVPKYRHGAIQLQLTMGSETQVLHSALEYGTWHHVSLVLASGDATTTATTYLVRQDPADANSQQVVDLINGATTSFAAGRLSPESTWSVGAAGNPSAVDAATSYEPWMAEFQLWDFPRSNGVITAERFQRRNGTETGLQLHLPLDRQESNTSQLALLETGSGLALDLVPAAEVSRIPRERILLVYGDRIFSLRSNLKDVGNVYTLQANAFTPRYDLSIVGQGDAAFIGVDSSDTNITVEAYRDNAFYPLDRFQPADRITVLNQSPSELSTPINEWNANINNARLLQDRNGAAQLDDNDSYIFDVHNQPGSYILDIGDEIFLVKIKLGNQRLRTAEERLQSEATGDSNFTLYFDRERILEITSGFSPQFEFTRLNTFAVQTLSERLFGDGIDGLLNLEVQEATLERPFENLVDPSNANPNDANAQIIAPRYLPDSTSFDNRIDFDGAYGLYYEEIFFHIPFLIANQLNANQQFEDAQTWYHYIFNPTAQEIDITTGLPSTRADRFWRYRPFRHLTLETLSELLTNETAIERYRSDPFDPHAIASLRLNTYQKSVVMKYIDNLMDWGDYLFRQDTRESINEAIPLYVMAFNLLGDRPQIKRTRPFVQAGDLRDVQTDIAQSPEDFPNDRDNNEITDFLFQLNGKLDRDRPLQVPFDPHLTVATRFCVPENAQFIGFWDRVEDRLFKIRNSLNIDGVFRSLALFQPPIDPAALVNAVAGGGLAGGLSNAIAAGNLPVPHYRYSFMLDRAKEMIGNVISLGSDLLDALEKQDAEALSVLQQNHEIGLLELSTTIKKLQIDEAQLNRENLELTRSSAVQKRDRHNDWIGGGDPLYNLNGAEIAQVVLLGSKAIAQAVAVVANTIASVTGALPDIEVGGSGFGGSPVATVKGGGSTASKVATAVGTVAQVAAEILDTSANITGLFAGYERRSDGWKLERDQAEFEIQQIDKQIEAIDVQISSLTQDLRIHEQNIVQQQEVADFLQTKFTNQALYNWMGNRLSGIYFQTYKLAFDLAKETERAYQFEFGATDTYISFGHWDSRRKGLLAGEALLLELNQLEKSALDQDSRYLEITKPISLARLDPLALIDLKTTGRCQFSLGELLFDRDFPGHYFRIIKAVSLSIPAVVGPYQTVKATLTQTGHKTLLAPDIEGVNYLLGESDTIPGSIRADWRANQQIALSTGVDDSGVFELNFNDDRYLPFEGTGAVSNWLLEMPLSTNAIDFDTISDVVINLRYMCKTDGGKFKQDVMDHPTVKAFSGNRLFSVAHEFAAQWHAFQNDDLDVDTLTLTLPPNAFPPNINVDLDTVQIQLLLGLDRGGNLVDVADGFTDTSNQAIPPLTLDISGPTPRFTFQARNNFDKTAIDNLLVIVSYDGQLR